MPLGGRCPWAIGEALNYHHGLYALVQDGQGFVVFQSQGLSPDAGEEALHTGEGSAFGVRHHGNARFHTLAFKGPAYSPAPPSVWIAADTEHHTQFLDGLRRDLALYVLVAIALCGLLSWLAARQGLAPLRDMKSRAAQGDGPEARRAHARAGRARGRWPTWRKR